MHLELHDIFLTRTVTGCIGIQPRAAHLIEHPHGRLAIAEGHPAADQRTGQREGIHCHHHLTSGGRWSFRFFDFLGGFGFLDEVDAKIEDQETCVHVSDGDAELLLEVALQIRHGGTLCGTLFEKIHLIRCELAAAEHALFIGWECRPAKPQARRD